MVIVRGGMPLHSNRAVQKPLPKHCPRRKSSEDTDNTLPFPHRRVSSQALSGRRAGCPSITGHPAPFWEATLQVARQPHLGGGPRWPPPGSHPALTPSGQSPFPPSWDVADSMVLPLSARINRTFPFYMDPLWTHYSLIYQSPADA